MEISEGLSLNILSSVISSIWTRCVLKWTWYECLLSPCICYFHPSVTLSQEINVLSLAELPESTCKKNGGVHRVLPSFHLVAGETVPSEGAFGETSELDPVADPALSRRLLLETSRGSLQPQRSCEWGRPVAALVLPEWTVQDVSARAGISR